MAEVATGIAAYLSSGPRLSPVYGQAGCAGAHYLEARQAYAGRVRKDEDPSHRWGGDSGAGGFSLSRGSDCEGAPRKMGWERVSERAARGRDSDRGANSCGRGLPGRDRKSVV